MNLKHLLTKFDFDTQLDVLPGMRDLVRQIVSDWTSLPPNTYESGRFITISLSVSVDFEQLV